MYPDPLRADCPIRRRTFLQAGGLSALGLGLPALYDARAAAATRGGYGRAKACILLYMLGGPPQQETFDLKPHAPGKARSLFKPIATTVPGLQICELLPRLARHAHRLAVIRSTFHGANALFHGAGVHYNLTGWANFPRDGEPFMDRRDYPCVGAVIRHLRGDRGRLPAAVQLPMWITQDGPGREWAGQTAGFLGRRYDPVILPYDREGTLPGNLPPTFVRSPDVAAERLDRRVALLPRVGRQGVAADTVAGKEWTASQAKAIDVLASPRAWKALAIEGERPALRDCYGDDAFGRSCLVARRLVEAGVSLVTVVFGGWDTHSNHLEHTRDRLLPPLDRAFSALLEDMADRGMLADTLVAWTGEFGRTPWTNASVPFGRDHWNHVYTTMLAGAGVRGGQVLGSSDKLAAEPKERPVHVGDYVATIYHALGFGPDTQVTDVLGRSHFVVPGSPLHELF